MRTNPWRNDLSAEAHKSRITVPVQPCIFIALLLVCFPAKYHANVFTRRTIKGRSEQKKVIPDFLPMELFCMCYNKIDVKASSTVLFSKKAKTTHT